MPDVVVKKSSLHGKGVFAKRDFKKAEIVLIWNNPTLLSRTEMKKLPEKQKKFVSKFGKNKFILYRAPDRFVNHSYKPNTRVVRMTNVAKRNIRKGEEITTDYTKEGVKIDFTSK